MRASRACPRPVHSHPIPFADELSCLWQLVHGSQATGTDIDRACNTIDLDAATVHIQHKTTARALLRERHIIAMHGLAFAYFTTTRHINLPLYFRLVDCQA